MKRLLNSISLTRIFDFLFWTACLLYFRFVVYTPLIAERQEPAFLFGSAFFDKTVSRPGGFVEYVSLFLTRCMEFPWLGAALLFSLVAAIAFAWRVAAIRIAGGRQTGLPSLVPAAILAGLHGHYAYRLATDVGLLLAFGSIAIVLLIGRGREWLTGLLTLALSPVLYWTAGGPFLLLLAWIWIRALLVTGMKWPVRAAWILVLPAVARFLPWVFDPSVKILGPEVSVLKWLPFDLRFPIPYLFPGFAASIFILEIVYLLPDSWIRPERIQKSFVQRRSAWTTLARTAGLFIPLLLLAGIARFSPDGAVRSRLLIGDHAHHGRWNAVLVEALKHPEYDKPAAFLVNRALERLGVLGEEMFRYSRKWGLDGLIPLKEQALAAAMDYSDFWFDLGDVNEAEHWAHEALTQKGETPRVLERLAQVNLIKNNREMAQSAVALMERSPFMEPRAEHYRLLLNHPNEMTVDLAVANAVRLRPKRDFIVRLHLPEAEVLTLMRQNPANRAAFEYYMAYTMLARELYLFVREFGRINTFSYARIPTQWEEALIMFMVGKGQREPVFAGRAIRSETIRRFNDFQRILASRNNDRIGAKDALAEKYADTYWFFLLYAEPNARTDSESDLDSVTGATAK